MSVFSTHLEYTESIRLVRMDLELFKEVITNVSHFDTFQSHGLARIISPKWLKICNDMRFMVNYPCNNNKIIMMKYVIIAAHRA